MTLPAEQKLPNETVRVPEFRVMSYVRTRETEVLPPKDNTG